MSGRARAMLDTVKQGVLEKTHRKKEDLKDDLVQRLAEAGIEVPLVDLQIQFIGASGLPKMDVVGTADPYFVAKLDDRITFVSNVIKNTLSPVWNETWRIKNVPSTASLNVEVHDKDEGSATDDLIGRFTTSVSPGAKELEIQGSVLALRKARGTFWLKIESSMASEGLLLSRGGGSSRRGRGRVDKELWYLFDGPIRFTRHFSPTIGLLTARSLGEAAGGSVALGISGLSISTTAGILLPTRSPNPNSNSTSYPDSNPNQNSGNDPRLYSTWKFHITNVPLHFGDTHQGWNRAYPAAQKIFGTGPGCVAVRRTIQAGHSMLYARLADNGSGTLDTRVAVGEGGGFDVNSIEQPITLKEVLHAGSPLSTTMERIKPAIYTYIISSKDDTLRFSETGAAFFVDFASKHALHSNCATEVRYSGEFHPRPVGGWKNFGEGRGDEDVEWELVVDNNSGTYAPDKNMLGVVKACLEDNFGCLVDPVVMENGIWRRPFRVVVYDREDERLVESREECREYAVKVRGVRQEELQPHVGEDEVTLSEAAAAGSEAR